MVNLYTDEATREHDIAVLAIPASCRLTAVTDVGRSPWQRSSRRVPAFVEGSFI